MVRIFRSVVVASAFPPPLHGVSLISSRVGADLARLTDVKTADLSAGSLERTYIYHVQRARRVLLACAKILRNAFRPRPCLYVAADGGFGLLYTTAIVVVARLSRHKIFIHHHSFSAIDRGSSLMTALRFCSGDDAVHIFLCGLMQKKYLLRYPGASKGMVSSNAHHLTLRPHERVFSNELRIGLLSNLTREKGLYRFVELLRACCEHGLAVRGVLAGPIFDDADLAFVRNAQAEFGDRLAYIGAVYGAQKDDFYRNLDVFVFPTSYHNEAQPVVVFEAMSFGLAVISVNRGCLAEDLTADCGLIVKNDANFVSEAHGQVARWCAARDELVSAQAASLTRLELLCAAAAKDYDAMLHTISQV